MPAMGSGDYRQVGKAGDWGSTQAMTGLGGKLYLVAGGDLYRLHPGTGDYEKLGGGGWKTKFLVPVLGKLVSIEEGGTVYALSPRDGSYEQLSGDGEWAGTVAATSVRDTVFTRSESGSLYAYKARFRTYEQLGSGTWTSRLLAGTTDGLFTADNSVLALEESGSLYAVNAGTGEFRALPGGWGTTRAMVGIGGALHTSDKGGAFYTLDVVTGTYGQLGGESSWKTRLLAAAAGRLYSLEESGTLFEIEP